jgi:ribosomal protein L7/L12
MAKIIFTGYQYGMQKIEFTKLLKNTGGLGLHEAKQNTDNLLKGEIIVLIISNLEEADSFALKARNLGVVCEVSEK